MINITDTFKNTSISLKQYEMTPFPTGEMVIVFYGHENLFILIKNEKILIENNLSVKNLLPQNVGSIINYMQ